uniref:Uncharacterized protein n=1 Tax=Oryza nivara TaxID=4536 RepID=A0A0E0GRB2_ORYNI
MARLSISDPSCALGTLIDLAWRSKIYSSHTPLSNPTRNGRLDRFVLSNPSWRRDRPRRRWLAWRREASSAGVAGVATAGGVPGGTTSPLASSWLMPLTRRVTESAACPPGSVSAEPQAPVEEPHGTGRHGERGCRRHRRQEEERVGRAGSAGGVEEVRVQMQVQVQSWSMTTTTMPAAARTSAPGGFLEGESGISLSVYGARTCCVEEPKPTAQATPVGPTWQWVVGGERSGCGRVGGRVHVGTGDAASSRTSFKFAVTPD